MHFKKFQKTYLFSRKTDISKNVLFWNVDDLYTKMLAFKLMRVWHSGTSWTTDVKVHSGRSSDPTLGDLFI